MPAIDLVDDTFLAVPRERVAAAFADPVRWPQLWPDLDLEVTEDRGAQGFRWAVAGCRAGTMEVWLEEVLDGTVLHWFLRVDPPGRAGPRTRRQARADAAEAWDRRRAAKGIAFALKRELEAGRPPGEPPPG